MSPRVLACEACQLRLEGSFVVNEFAGLRPELLHVLRIFVHCEGRIKDMEKALGVSYPTVKGLLAQLKAAVAPPAREATEPAADASADDATSPVEATAAPTPALTRLEVLEALERGELSHDDAVRRLKSTKK